MVFVVTWLVDADMGVSQTLVCNLLGIMEYSISNLASMLLNPQCFERCERVSICG